MTPAIKAARKAGVNFKIHEYHHDSDSTDYGEEAVAALGQPAERVFKTLLVAIAGDKRNLAVAVVPVAGLLNLKAMAAALKVKKVGMADPVDAERATGYVVGGISPLGQKKRLPVIVDDSAESFETIYMSAGRRGLEIEMSLIDLIGMTNGKVAPIGRD